MKNTLKKNLKMLAEATKSQAKENLDKRGLQNFDQLILAASEELGEVAKEIRRVNKCAAQCGHPEDLLVRVIEEAQDLGAVALQIQLLADYYLLLCVGIEVSE